MMVQVVRILPLEGRSGWYSWMLALGWALQEVNQQLGSEPTHEHSVCLSQINECF